MKIIVVLDAEDDRPRYKWGWWVNSKPEYREGCYPGGAEWWTGHHELREVFKEIVDANKT